ncbi:MAG: O-antigen ligase family protein [Streptosporangiaceae bacterium]|nr:O-antigen ligase family protein [Streptosporangiaceae bacterium]
MSKSSIWVKDIQGDMLKLASPSFIKIGIISICGLVLGVMIGKYDPFYGAMAGGAAVLALLIILRQDEAALVLVLTVHLYFDWYWGLSLGAQLLELALLFYYYYAHSERLPWILPPALWLWLAFVLLAILPSLHGIILTDTLNYYFNIFFGSLTIYWLGVLIGRDTVNVRRAFQFLALLGTLVAIHTIIETLTGIFLFATTRYDAYFATVSYYELATTTIQRAGSFLINPDSNGGFFGIMMFLPLCLFVESSSFFGKLCYLVQAFLMLVALLFTYSTGGWLAAGVGAVGFVIFACPTRYRVMMPLIAASIVIAIVVCFPTQVNLQIQHALAPTEAALRTSAWQTGIQVIRAFPLLGIGVGRYVYFERADPYRVLGQYIPLAHPHNSYIEIGALAGIPIMLVFLALLIYTCWLSIRTWMRADRRTRMLLGGGLATIVSLSANSMVANAWTLIPLAAIGWFILGVMSSPLLANSRGVKTT